LAYIRGFSVVVYLAASALKSALTARLSAQLKPSQGVLSCCREVEVEVVEVGWKWNWGAVHFFACLVWA